MGSHHPSPFPCLEYIGISGFAHPNKRINRQDNEFWLRLCVVHEVEIDEFLLLEILGLHVLEHVGKETRDVLRSDVTHQRLP